jgi:Bacteriocin-protection, YdeI or OmpD-Associated
VAIMRGRYLLGLSNANRQAAGFVTGDQVVVEVEIDAEPRVVVEPADFARALDADPVARTAYDRLSYSRKREHVLAIESAKKPETRTRLIGKALATLRDQESAEGPCGPRQHSRRSPLTSSSGPRLPWRERPDTSNRTHSRRDRVDVDASSRLIRHADSAHSLVSRRTASRELAGEIEDVGPAAAEHLITNREVAGEVLRRRKRAHSSAWLSRACEDAWWSSTSAQSAKTAPCRVPRPSRLRTNRRTHLLPLTGTSQTDFW